MFYLSRINGDVDHNPNHDAYSGCGGCCYALLVVSNFPLFSFSHRFGEVVQTSKVAEDLNGAPQFLVEFSNMYGAEAALRGGMNFNNTTLTAEYRAKKIRTESVGSNPSTTGQDGM